MKKKCTRCKWHENDFVNCTGYFPPELEHADIVFLGEAYGRNEALQGKPFVGDAGTKYDDLLEYAGLNRDEVITMNSMRCYLPGNPTPTKAEMDACFIHVLRDLKKIKPKLVVAMGGSALYQASGREGVETYKGKVFWSDKIKCKVFVTNHPAASIYDPKKWWKLRRHFKLIPSLVNTELNEVKNYNYEFIDSDDRFKEIYKDMLGKTVMFDLETTGLDVYRDEITELQIATSKDIVYVIDGDLLSQIRNELAELFRESPVVGQGFEFDAKNLSTHLDILPKKWEFDTCLAEYILTGLKDNDLSFLVGKYATESLGYDEEVYAMGGAHKVADPNKRRQYAATDVGVLFPIQRKQKKLLIKEKKLDLFEKIVMPTNKVLTKMSLRGIKYDLNHLWKIDEKYKRRAGRLLAKVKDLDGVKAAENKFKRHFNPRSTQMVHWMLLDYYDLPVIKQITKGKNRGNPTIGKEEMKRYAKEHKNPYCIAMEKYRSYQNIRDNFLSGVVPKLYGDVGHTTYSLHVAASGRPVSTNPNLLNIPREKDIKRIFIARDGHQFVYADYAQLEVRIAAVVYDEPALIEICNDFDKDIHCNITSKAFKKDYDYVYNGYKNGDVKVTELRVKGKIVQFSIIYQKGAESLGYDLSIPTDEAQQFIDEYYENFPNLADNIEKTKELIIKQGYLDNYFGFRRRWKDHSPDDHHSLREGVNHMVQSLAWNIMEMAMIEVDNRLEENGLEAGVILQVYDALVVEAPDNEVAEVAHIMRDVMENIHKPYDSINRVKLKADTEVGRNLADMKEYLN